MLGLSAQPELSKKRTAISSKVAQSVPKLPLELVQVVLRFQWQRRDRLLHLHLQVSKAHIQLLVLKEHVLLYAPMDRPRLHVLSAHPRLRVLNSRLQSRVIDDHLRVGEVILSVAPHVLHGAHWLAWRFHGNISTST
ncbi:hypothetical protein PF002_g15822 [Phytophthora fragariae]|uniref:Uncharacterized protein n=1 Tax=Phytophthora fragariae TaxID=53985 RepID=A0A6A4D6D9_9STRA|nr:hypothetical protein PF011_g13501 [Phytophthora fragariae]KAE9220654.1 hypothetical protein PF002_g15822 [Phytophthora fragariae]KAE9302887.1 hypothetical protein PF001_g13807 [Phytophthora fragariae]